MINMAMRYLDAKGKGEADYDLMHDVLFFKVKNREYDRSIEIDNIVIDIDKEDFPMGMQMFDASEFLRMPKIALKNVQKWQMEASVEGNKLEVRLLFTASQRNKIKEITPIIREQLKESLPNSEMILTAKASKK